MLHRIFFFAAIANDGGAHYNKRQSSFKRRRNRICGCKAQSLHWAIPSSPPTARARGTRQALSLFKMEGVWLSAVTALSAEDAQKALEKAGLSSYFRFVLTESVALCKADSGTMFERAMKRLHSQKDDTIGLSGSLAAIKREDAVFAPWRCREVRARRTGRRCSNSPRRALRSTANCCQILCEFWENDRIRRFFSFSCSLSQL